MTSKEITPILIEVEKRMRKGIAVGLIDLPTNTLEADKILYNPMKNDPATVSLVSDNFKVDLSWSKLSKTKQEEIINILKSYEKD